MLKSENYSIPPLRFRSALVATNSEGHARVDARFLKKANIPNVRTITSMEAAKKVLAKHYIDIILCDESLDDMSGIEFARELKNSVNYREIPILMAAVPSHRGAVLDAVAAGCSGYMIRPYSMRTLLEQLLRVNCLPEYLAPELAAVRFANNQMSDGNHAAALHILQRIAAEPEDQSLYFQEALEHLEHKEYEEAILVFKKALKFDPQNTDAQLGLAKAWLRKKNTTQGLKYLTIAASQCATLKIFAQKRHEFIDIIENDAEGFNPFFGVGQDLIRSGKFKQALDSLRIALDLTPGRGDILAAMGRVYHFLRQPEKALEAVVAALEKDAENTDGRQLYRNLTGESWGGYEKGDILPLLDESPDDFSDKNESQANMDSLGRAVNAVLYITGKITDSFHGLKNAFQSPILDSNLRTELANHTITIPSDSKETTPST